MHRLPPRRAARPAGLPGPSGARAARRPPLSAGAHASLPLLPRPRPPILPSGPRRSPPTRTPRTGATSRARAATTPTCRRSIIAASATPGASRSPDRCGRAAGANSSGHGTPFAKLFSNDLRKAFYQLPSAVGFSHSQGQLQQVPRRRTESQTGSAEAHPSGAYLNAFIPGVDDQLALAGARFEL